jgi:hypothetical protein
MIETMIANGIAIKSEITTATDHGETMMIGSEML